MAYDQVSPNTSTTLSTAPLGNANNVRQLWRKGALLAEANDDFFQEFESKSDRGLIWSQTDLSKGEGSTMNFTTQAGFYKKPKLGDALFEASTDFDKIRQENFQLNVDFARWAIRTNKRMEEIMGMRNDIEKGINVEQGKTLGRFKTEQLLGMAFHKLPAANVIYANGKTLDTLVSADTLRWDEIVMGTQTMMPMGGLPANIAGRHAKQPIWSNTYVATTAALLSLKLDSAYRDVLKSGDTRGAGNTIFKGGYPAIDGNTIVPYNPIDHDGAGPMGSFLNPKAFLGNAALTAGTTARVVYGGGNDTDHLDSEYFRYFDGSPYEYIDTGAITPSTGTKYFIIYNLTGASAGKWGMYAYTTGNDGVKITCTAHLGAAIAGVQNTTLGSVVYDAALNTTDHPIGSFIAPCNAKGVLIGDTLGFGRAAILRGYGMYRADHTVDKLNGGFVTDRYLCSVFGQTYRKDRKNRVPSALRIRHAITYPGIKLPTVV